MAKEAGFSDKDALRVGVIAGQIETADKPTIGAMSAELRDIYQRNYARMSAAGQIPTGKGKGKDDGPEPTAADKKVLDKLNEMMNTPGFIQDDVGRVGRLIAHLKGALDSR